LDNRRCREQPVTAGRRKITGCPAGIEKDIVFAERLKRRK